MSVDHLHRVDSHSIVKSKDRVDSHKRWKQGPPVGTHGNVLSVSRSEMAKTKTTPRRPLCPMCRVLIPETETFEAHLLRCANERVDNEHRCELCDKHFKKAYLQKHRKLQHGPPQKPEERTDEDSLCIESLGDDPDIQLDYEDSTLSESDVGLVPEEKQNDDRERLLEGKTTRKPTTTSMPGPRKRMYVDKGVGNDDVEKKRKVETGKDIDVDNQAVPSMATAPCMSDEAKSGEILIHQEVTDETRRHNVRITCKDKVMFENSVTVSREMDMGSTNLDIGQYRKSDFAR